MNQPWAVELLITSKDRIFAWQGVAGAGKSFSLGEACKIAQENNFIVKGFAPSAEAAKNLKSEAKLIETNTVASLLVQNKQDQKYHGKEIWIVDEAGLLSASDAHKLFKKSEEENVRILLVGDTRQLSSVGAGNPFKQLQKNGMKTAHLNQGVRQKDPLLKQSVDLIAQGDALGGLDLLDKNGKVFEKNSTEEIISHMANEYLELNSHQRKNSLFICSTNFEKEEITKLIRNELKSKNELINSVETIAYKQYNFNEFQLKNSNYYNVDDVLILTQKHDCLNSNQIYRVKYVDKFKNTVTLDLGNNCEKEFDVKKISANLFREEKFEISQGDKIKWTKNHFSKENLDENKKSERRLNGQYIFVKNIDFDKKIATVEYENGKNDQISLNKPQFLDHSYVTTVFSSQGKTCDKVYASLNRVDKENFYVAVSRAKYDCKIYSLNKENLFKNVEKTGAKKTAHEKLKQPYLNCEDENLKNKQPNIILNEVKKFQKMTMRM